MHDTFISFSAPVCRRNLSLITWVLRPLVPCPPAPPPHPAAGRPGWITTQQQSLLINRSHSVLTVSWVCVLMFFFPSLLCDSLLFFISLFLMRALLFYPTHPDSIHCPASFLVILEMALKAFMFSDNLNRNVLINAEPDAGLSPQNWHRWTSAEHNYHPECVVS